MTNLTQEQYAAFELAGNNHATAKRDAYLIPEFLFDTKVEHGNAVLDALNKADYNFILAITEIGKSLR
jgi:hypothetical protein